jgi:hypothetical protein
VLSVARCERSPRVVSRMLGVANGDQALTPCCVALILDGEQGNGEGPHVAKTVQHVSEQGSKAGTVQPITTKPSVGSEGGVGVVVHLSKIREK